MKVAFVLISAAAAYNPSAAVSWADSHCGSGSSECAEFASEAIKAGGHANGCYSAWVPDLDSCLKNNAGWKKTSFPCSKGSVVIWQDSQGPYHAAISRGDGTIDQHNPNRCQSSGSWGDNYCLSPPSFAATANESNAEKQPLESSVDVGISMSQIASYWISKHSKDNCQTAVAVAMAESSGNCGASHTNSGGTIDRGLWQINDYYHPECSNSCAYDCACNAGCAVSVWQSSGWSAWATWKAGAHSKYMNDAAVACGYSSEQQDKSLTSSVDVGYSPSAAVSWADSHCGSGSSECAEFASDAIKAGGHANGCYSAWVPDLDSCLKKNAGWKQTSFPCSKGSVVIWYDSQGPYHAAISRGDGTIDQHNPNRCQTSGSWGSNYCLSPPSFTENDANLTVMV